MKKALLIILISFVSVVGAVGLLVGGMYLFGGFNEKIVYAQSIAFTQTEVVSDDTFFLKITTPTEDVTQTKFKLYVSAGGEKVISFPEYVELNKDFPIIPKMDTTSGVNYGGNVTLYAAYDGETSSQIAPAKCEILIDVPIEKIAMKSIFPSTAKPNDAIIIGEKNTTVISKFEISPAHALTPYTRTGTKKVSYNQNKAIYLELTDNNDNPITSTVAQFAIDGVNQNSNVIKVDYSYKNGAVVFDKTISLNTKNVQGELKVNAYVYSTYKQQDGNVDDNGNVSLVKGNMETSDAGFAVGSYTINDFTFNGTDKEIMLDLSEGKDGAVNLFLNNPNCKGGDVNLNVALSTDSTGIEVSDFYLYNMYLTINNEDYRLLFNDAADDDAEAYTTYGVRNKFVDISTQKDEWCWKVKVNNFLAYKNFVDDGTKLQATLKYIQTDGGTNINIEKTFYIVPRIVATENIDVVYNKEGDTSFKVESEKTLNFVTIGNKNVVRINNSPITETTPSNLIVTPNNATFKGLSYYISYAENTGEGKGVSTVPNKTGEYKITFSFKVEEQRTIYSIAPYLNDGWFTLNNVETSQVIITQGTTTRTVNALTNIAHTVSAEEYVNIQMFIRISSVPTDNRLIRITFDEGELVVTADDVKFYELAGKETGTNKNIYSAIPYLSVNNIRYYADYEVYFDSTLTKYLKLIFNLDSATGSSENHLKVVGIGSFVVTAQLCYSDNNNTYWLDNSARINVSVYENLKDLKVYDCTITESGGVETVTPKNFDPITLEGYRENESTGNIYIQSSTMQIFKNYVNSNQIEVFTKQVVYKKDSSGNYILDDGNKIRLTEAELVQYVGLQNINKNAITFGAFRPITENDNIIAYVLPYTIGEVKTINIEGIEYEPYFEIIIRAEVNGEYVYATYYVKNGAATREDNNLIVKVTDKVLTKAYITYDNREYDGVDNALTIYADSISAQTGIVYKLTTGSGSTSVDYAKLDYYFEYSDKSTTIDTLSVTPTVNGGVNISNLLDFVVTPTTDGLKGKGGLKLYNFPYKEDGVLLTLTVYSASAIDATTYYWWNNNNNSFESRQYDLSKTLYILVYGFKVDIAINDTSDIYGKKNEDVLLFGAGKLFNVTVSNHKGNGLNVSDYSKVFSIHTDSNVLTFDGAFTKVTPTVDFVEDTNVMFNFYVGANSLGNEIKIKDIGADTATLSYYTKLIKSPFVLDVAQTVFVAPSTNETFVTLKYDTSAISSVTIDGTITIAASIVSTTLNSNYNIEQPILITTNADYSISLTLKSVPANYTATMQVQITLTVNEVNYVRVVEQVITINNAFNNSNLKLNPVYDSVEEEYVEQVDANGYCHIDAGQEYSYAKVAINNTIILDGKFVDDLWVDKITSIDISYEDDDDIIYPLAESLMRNTAFDINSKSFAINSYDLNVNKKIVISFKFNFSDGGYTTITKQVLVEPNITLELVDSTLSVGQSITLNNNNAYKLNNVVGAFEISDDFDFEPGSCTYSKNSFSFDSAKFSATEEGAFYKIYAISTGTTQIVFNYRVLSGSGYTLRFVFNVEIV